jgi:hypothetical protein
MKNMADKNKELLSEELKRFQSLTDYNPSEGMINEMNLYLPEEVFMEDDLLEAEDEEEETTDDAEVEGGDEDIDAAIDDVASDMEGDEEGAEGEEELDLDSEEPMGDEEGLEDLGDEEGFGDEMEEPAEDEVEIDVTELVNSTEEAKAASEEVNNRMNDLMGQFDQLNSQLEKMNQLSGKIDDLEHEMETRMPTPEEKLEMRSLDSYPYNVKLTDYWADKEGQYDVMDGEAGKPSEYVLTQNDVESEYNEKEVEDSFENPYEEEEI